MYDKRTINRVLAMLRSGYRQSFIAKQCGVSRSLVSLYATGHPPKKHKGRPGQSFAYKQGLCPQHGKVRLPCVACAAERYVCEHPEHDWCDPLPLADDRARREAAEQMRLFNALDEFINPEGPT